MVDKEANRRDKRRPRNEQDNQGHQRTQRQHTHNYHTTHQHHRQPERAPRSFVLRFRLRSTTAAQATGQPDGAAQPCAWHGHGEGQRPARVRTLAILAGHMAVHTQGTTRVRLLGERRPSHVGPRPSNPLHNAREPSNRVRAMSIHDPSLTARGSQHKPGATMQSPRSNHRALPNCWGETICGQSSIVARERHN